MNAVFQSTFHKRRALAEWLESVGCELDLTDAERELARIRYEAVGEWLAASNHPWMQGAEIAVHGSIALGTINRPVGRDEFDVDAMSHLPAVPREAPPAQVKQVVGARLREHGRYAPLLEELPRCWRLNYSNEFHLDITPSTSHPTDPPPALIVPDKRLQSWTPSNPHGFRDQFEARAQLVPQFTSVLTKDARAAAVADFPIFSGPRGILRRSIQLMKRHRDLMFQSSEIRELRPISIIITTLAAYSYESAVSSRSYDSDYDLLLQVIAGMPSFINIRPDGTRRLYWVKNETVDGENFAEKWNHDARLPNAFLRWHRAVLAAIEELDGIEGLDELAKSTSAHFGSLESSRALDTLSRRMETARRDRSLGVSPSRALSVGVSAAVPIPRNTFFGRP